MSEQSFVWLDKIMNESGDKLDSKKVTGWIERLHKEKEEIECKMISAKRNYMANGERVNLQFLTHLEFSVKQRRRLIGALQVKLGEIKRIEKEARIQESSEQEKSFERLFFYNAHKILPRDLYELVLSKTRAQVDEAQSLPATSSASSS